MNVEFPKAFNFLFQPARYKVAFGGRGGAKSWAFARAILIIGGQRPIRVLCCRETQKSIQDSVHKLLADQIEQMGLSDLYLIEKARIIGHNGTEIIFTGLKHSPTSLKSYEGVDICWCEEAQNISRSSWEILVPTIRKDGSEIWVSYNPELESDATHQRFVMHPPPGAVVRKIGWEDNPFFPPTLRKEMEHMRESDPAAYHHVWGGNCKSIAEGAIYANEVRAAESEGRFARVPYDATKPVHTFWDLGWGDQTSIWMAQAVGREYHLIDFLDGSQKPLQHYVAMLQQRGYVFGTDYLPHDARAHELGSGRSVEELLRAAGRNVRIVQKLSVTDGINAARSLFRQCWFDSEKCADGLQALRHYRYEKDEDLGIQKREPLHDWSSHAADAFRYFAVSIQQPEREYRERHYAREETSDAWMA